MLTSSRTTNILLVLVLAGGIGVVAMLATRSAAGPLDPPAPPASTMHNIIFQPASCAGFPIVISAPGAYQLGSDITGCTGKDGIEIATSNVTLDLGGHNVGGGGFASGSTNGIRNLGANGQLTISNGHVQQWGTSGINLNGSSVALVDRVVATYNGANGIVIDTASAVTNSMGSANGAIFLSAGILAVGSNNRISSCQADSNHGDGVDLQADGTIVEDCEASGNTGAGINGQSIERIVNDHVHNNSLTGIIMGASATIEGNSSWWNGGNGLVCSVNCSLSRNTASNNSGDGIYVSGGVGVIADNRVFANGHIGIDVVATGSSFPNVVLRNVSTGNAFNDWSIGVGNDLGPIGAANSATSPSTNYTQ